MGVALILITRPPARPFEAQKTGPELIRRPTGRRPTGVDRQRRMARRLPLRANGWWPMRRWGACDGGAPRRDGARRWRAFGGSRRSCQVGAAMGTRRSAGASRCRSERQQGGRRASEAAPHDRRWQRRGCGGAPRLASIRFGRRVVVEGRGAAQAWLAGLGQD